MLRSRRLEVVLALEQRKEKEALEQMGEARKLVDQQRQQIADLNNYQQEYRNQIRSAQHGVVPVVRLQAWQAFIAQLDQVIAQQQKQLEKLEQVYDVRRREWQKAWERRRGMEKYIESCQQQEQRERDLQEQKQSDEAAGRQFARRHR